MRAASVLLAVACVAVCMHFAAAQSSSTGAAAPAQASSTAAAGAPSTICQTMALKRFPTRSFTDAAVQYETLKNFITSVATGAAQDNIAQTAAPNVGVFFNPITAKYFNGAFNYRQPTTNNTVVASPFAAKPTPDFTSTVGTNPAEKDLLVDHLAQFFGPALGCSTAAGFTPYSSKVGDVAFNQYQVHANMKLTQAEFASFNQQVGASLAAFGVTDAPRLAAATAVLNSFGRNSVNPVNQICYTSTCDCAPGTFGATCTCASGQTLTDGKCSNSAALAAPSMLLAALLAVFAMIRA